MNKIIALCLFLLVTGISVVFLSIVSYPVRGTEAYENSCSRNCYEHLQFNISPSNNACITVRGSGPKSTMPPDSILRISFQVQPDDLNFHIEGRSVVINYIDNTPRTIRDELPLFIPVIEYTSDWLTQESYSNVSSLNVNSASAGEYWVCRFRFENVGSINKTVDLSVIECWEELDYREVIMPCYLLPFGFAYIGAIPLASGLMISTWGITTKKFAVADVRNFVKELSEDISYYMGTKKIIIVLFLTLALLFLCLFEHTRLGVGEILVGEEVKKTFFSYHGFPFEIMGTATPLTMEDWALVHGPQNLFSREIFPTEGTNRYEHDLLYSSSGSSEGALLILWDGVILNFIIYFALSFALVLVLSYLSEKLHWETFIEKIGRRVPDF